MLKLMHAANITFTEVAIGSEVMHNFLKITRPLTLHVKPMGEFMKLDILTITGVWI